jgi:predicted negative regulator of RcsB-dependent stress response
MATHMEMKSRWENDGRRHIENELPAVHAKQGHTGRRVLTVLIAALVLAFIVWIPVELWGNHQAEEQSPASASQTQVPTVTPKSAPETPAEVDAQHR